MQEKVVLITGGSSGIGKQVALDCAKKGAAIVIADIDDIEGSRLQFEIISAGGRALFQQTDVTMSSSLQDAIRVALGSFGSVDYAFNNAGIESGFAGFTADYEEDLFLKMIDVNLSGVWRSMKYELEVMQEQKSGVIVNNASILGKVGHKTASPYCASKHGVIGLTKTAALEYATKGIRVNAVCPGYIETPMLERIGVIDDEQQRTTLENMHPVKRLGSCKEVTNAVLWLFSDEASFVTGTAMEVDGGYLAR
ncbi:MAG: glucose 1-dehydrogenase [Gammaproteobacteria bacterium]|nr:MAG: glucose 1-dehydrogenase [Gammaproteobacteria bacterium]